MMKGYKYRIYPNDEQVVLINKTIGCCRLIYNYMLDRKFKSYQRRNESLGNYDLIKLLPAVKKFKPFLKEVDSISLQQSIIHMDNAYKNFFKGHNKFVPSSHMCNNCKTINPAIKDLTIREWICHNCGASHNRDYNAALNILEEGLKLLA